jgi:hypothetical protein
MEVQQLGQVAVAEVGIHTQAHGVQAVQAAAVKVLTQITQ